MSRRKTQIQVLNQTRSRLKSEDTDGWGEEEEEKEEMGTSGRRLRPRRHRI